MVDSESNSYPVGANPLNPLAPEATVGFAIRDAATALSATSDTARLDAEVLMAHALGVDRSVLLLSRMRDAVPENFTSLVERRKTHEPVAYIVGNQEFYGLPFKVGPDVLIPRGDSETLVEAALSARPDAKSVLDCGTGSGALLLATLSQLPEARGVGVDRSVGALAIAQANAELLGLADRALLTLANWHEAGWSTPLQGPFDLVLTNPPYVEDDASLDNSVREFEPASALFSGPDGLDDYRVLVPQLLDLLTPNGVALVEIGYQQADAVTAIGVACGMDARLHLDLAGRPRVIAFTRTN